VIVDTFTAYYGYEDEARALAGRVPPDWAAAAIKLVDPANGWARLERHAYFSRLRSPVFTPSTSVKFRADGSRKRKLS
jgi:hypothetical protein